MKRFFVLLIAVMFIASVCLVPVSAAEVIPSQEIDENQVTPRFVHTYQKIVTMVYEDYDSIPASIEYKEYKTESWFTGTLHLQSVVRQSDGTWLATYRGLLQGLL